MNDFPTLGFIEMNAKARHNNLQVLIPAIEEIISHDVALSYKKEEKCPVSHDLTVMFGSMAFVHNSKVSVSAFSVSEINEQCKDDVEIGKLVIESVLRELGHDNPYYTSFRNVSLGRGAKEEFDNVFSVVAPVVSSIKDNRSICYFLGDHKIIIGGQVGQDQVFGGEFASELGYIFHEGFHTYQDELLKNIDGYKRVSAEDLKRLALQEDPNLALTTNEVVDSIRWFQARELSSDLFSIIAQEQLGLPEKAGDVLLERGIELTNEAITGAEKFDQGKGVDKASLYVNIGYHNIIAQQKILDLMKDVREEKWSNVEKTVRNAFTSYYGKDEKKTVSQETDMVMLRLKKHGAKGLGVQYSSDLAAAMTARHLMSREQVSAIFAQKLYRFGIEENASTLSQSQWSYAVEHDKLHDTLFKGVCDRLRLRNVQANQKVDPSCPKERGEGPKAPTSTAHSQPVL